MGGQLTDILVMLAVVFAVNLMPVFGPPTWTALVFFFLRWDIAAPVLVIGGAAASAGGRFVLASAFRHLSGHLPAKKRRDLEAVGAKVTGRGASRYALLGVFVVSPLSSAQLFEAAGLTPQVKLVPVTIAFFCGRLVTYSLYVGGASVAQDTLRDLLARGIVSPATIALQVGLLGLLIAFVLVPWARVLGLEDHDDATPHPPRTER